ncbi:MAG TPA: LPXTG cell wall anchor domain-containing protein [Solirubrobacteraceae bacterium]|jgi:LPXTG-motif cell wall-anchored protein
MTARKKLGASALVAAVALICLLPAVSQSGGKADLRNLNDALRQTTQKLGSSVDQSLDRTAQALRKTDQALRRTTDALKGSGTRAKIRATATDPARQPPLHGANPHGQGGVAVVDIDPSPERPLSGNTDGSGPPPEEIVVGRARGEKNAAGQFHGHITIAALLGNELLGVDTAPGETKAGPLDAIQKGILDPLCNGTSQQICLSLVTANSATTASGSTNDFAVARAKLGNLNINAAESRGTISEDKDCQTSNGSAKTANVVTSTGAIAEVANSESTSTSCRGKAPQTLNKSTVIALGGQGLPLPATGCANGTPDTVAGLPPLLPIVCNADEIVGAAAVREALDVFVLSAGNTSLLKETTAASESVSVAPAGPEVPGGPQCSDKVDNDKDGVIDKDDPGCHSDNNPKNDKSYVVDDNDETDKAKTGGSGQPSGGGKDNGGEGNGNEGGPTGGSGAPECSDKTDNDGDGAIDSADPGCHSDGNPNNSASYNPSDDSEADSARSANAGSLPFTGTDITGLALAGLLLLAGGLLMRRREGSHARL